MKKMKNSLVSDLRSMLGRDGIAKEDRFTQTDKRLNSLIETVVDEVKLYAQYQISHVKRLAQVGLALSGEKDINKLLEMIVDAARDLTNADAGTLYILDNDNRCLRFEILQNDTMGTRMGGKSGDRISLPPVPLERKGKANYSNVSSYAALTGKIVNISDVYEAEGFDFSGVEKYDKTTGYRSKSMLVIPMKDHENDIIGVLQLLNAKDIDSGEVIAFAPDYVDLIGSLASQAAIALTNTRLIKDLKGLFYSFIKSIATAIDEKSPYTAGHFTRVVKLTMMIAESINEAQTGPFADINFSEDEMEELHIAAWMHDIGKITTPEYVVDKRTKLETIFDRIELVNTRFDLVGRITEIRYLNEKLDIYQNVDPDTNRIERLNEDCERALQELEEEKTFVIKCNLPGEFLSDEKIERLRQIACKTYKLGEKEFPYLEEKELFNLSVKKGNLTPGERKVIENHAVVTRKMLKELPFPKKLANVPDYAGGHHENLKGSGYPLGLAADQLPLQARIMAIADVFEALTAKDRPYKKPMKLSQAIEILKSMKDEKEIDPDIYDLFINRGIYKIYAKNELIPDQIDIADV